MSKKVRRGFATPCLLCLLYIDVETNDPGPWDHHQKTLSERTVGKERYGAILTFPPIVYILYSVLAMSCFGTNDPGAWNEWVKHRRSNVEEGEAWLCNPVLIVLAIYRSWEQMTPVLGTTTKKRCQSERWRWNVTGLKPTCYNINVYKHLVALLASSNCESTLYIYIYMYIYI